MKRTLLLLLLLLFLVAIYFGITKFAQSKDTSIKLEDREFVVDDPSKIDIITVESAAYPMKHFSRQKNNWLLNNKYKVEPNIVKNMLMVLTKMRIHHIPPKNSVSKVKDLMKEIGMTIRTFDKNGNVLSEFVLGGNTQAEDASYCMKIGANQPYAMSIPVYDGGLRSYFNQTHENLITKIVYDFDNQQVTGIEMNYNKSKKSSF